MNKEIIGRAIEKETLQDLLNRKEASFLSVYGRRRVGKTYLIRQFYKKQIVFDLTGMKHGTVEEQMENFFKEYLFRTKGQRESTTPKSWLQAFDYLVAYLQSISHRKTKLVVFLDEMPWMDGPRSRFINALEFLWNQHLNKMDNVILVACGSSSSWILKNLIQARGGLYNRVTHRIKLKPFTLYETELFFKYMGIKFSRLDILYIYMTMGGIPHYLKEIKKKESIAQILNKLCFRSEGLLYDEYHQIYHSLFVNAENHLKIIELLAKHHYGLTQSNLRTKSKLPQSSLVRMLDELEECDFITKYYPIDKKKKDATYRLSDFYSLFYLRFIKNHKPGLKEAWKQYSTTQAYAVWGGYAYENVCLAHMDQITFALGISGISTSVNSWVFKGDGHAPGVQIDLMIERADRAINLCEVKFSINNFILTKDYVNKIQLKRSVFTQISGTRQSILTALITVLPPVNNVWLNQEIDAVVTLEDLFRH